MTTARFEPYVTRVVPGFSVHVTDEAAARAVDLITAKQSVTCPFCGGRVAGLLAGCGKPDCRRRELNEDAAYTRAMDR